MADPAFEIHEELDGLERLADASMGGDPKVALLQSVARLRRQLVEANVEDARCECCERRLPRDDMELQPEDGIYLCKRCIDDLTSEGETR